MNVEFHKQVKRMFKFWRDVDLESRVSLVLESLPVYEGDKEETKKIRGENSSKVVPFDAGVGVGGNEGLD